jgi:hypothetical protein
MSQWVIFIPRPAAVANLKDSGEKGLPDQAKTWVDHSDGKLLESNIKLAGANTLPTNVLSSQDARLYIMGGHCKEGRNYLTWPGESNQLCCHQVGDALVAAGLPTTFAGQVKVYSCLSADNKGSAVAFAKLFAIYLKHLGFNSCRVFGYTGAVSKGYVNSGTEKEPLGQVKKTVFKQPDELGKGYHRYALVPGGYGPRGKNAKKEFTVSPGTAIQIAHCNICNRF